MLFIYYLVIILNYCICINLFLYLNFFDSLHFCSSYLLPYHIFNLIYYLIVIISYFTFFFSPLSLFFLFSCSIFVLFRHQLFGICSMSYSQTHPVILLSFFRTIPIYLLISVSISSAFKAIANRVCRWFADATNDFNLWNE